MRAERNLSREAPARGVVAMGVLGGMTVTALEYLRLQASMPLLDVLQVVAKILPQWAVVGTVIGALAVFAERRWRGGAIALAFVATALVTSAALAGMRALLASFVAHSELVVFEGERLGWAMFLYDLWITLFFGGLFLVACVLQLRARRTRHVLAQAGIERVRTEALLGEAELRSLRARVDPAFLLRVMGEVSRRYERDGTGADRLLDALVVFLRRAMPGVREAGSTLADELALAGAYARIWHELDPARPQWTVRVDATLPRIPFPPLVLLPALDRWAEAAPPGSAAELGAEVLGGVVTLALDDGGAAPAGWIGAGLGYRLHVALGALYGDRNARATAREGGLTESALSVSIPADGGRAATAPDASPAPIERPAA